MSSEQAINSAKIKGDLDYSFLDGSEFNPHFVQGANLNKVRFYVEGMTCSKCIKKLEDLAFQEGVLSLQVDFGKKLVSVEVDRQLMSFAKMAESIGSLGFRPIPISSDSEAEQHERHEERTELVRLAVAGACAANIMTFSFATYLGASKEFAFLFSWLSFFLYLPVLTFVAFPFYRGALNSLKSRTLSVDLPMAIASLAGFFLSSYNLFLGKEDIYFDSISGFLFLILISRWAQRKMQKKFLRSQDLLEAMELQRVRRSHENGWSWTPIDRIRIEDRVLLHAYETSPVEGVLISERSYFSLAWLSGESRPKTFLSGSVVPAGSKLLSGTAQIVVRKKLPQTEFGRILEQVQNSSLTRTRIMSMADRWSQVLLTVVFLAAVAFLFSYWSVSPEEAARRSLALIILACPCAMAFGTPLSLSSGLRQARKSGIIVRNANVFEKVKGIKNVFFDKTGTLTDAELSLVEPIHSIPIVYQKIILSLENGSMHPIAFAFRSVLPAPDVLPPVDGWREEVGVGVSGYLFGKFYELRSNSKLDEKTMCTLFEDRVPVMNFSFASSVKAGSLEILQELRKEGYKLFLISGDQPSEVENLGRQLGFSSSEIFGGLSPQKKAEIISKHEGTMIIGDGVNDSLAMLQSDVSVTVSGGVEAALKSSDVYLIEPGLSGVRQLFRVSNYTISLILQNLTISAIYNTVGGVFALLGFINPFVAAVLMPISSGFILFSTWLRARDL